MHGLFSKDIKIARRAFLEKQTSTNKFQIELEVVWLPFNNIREKNFPDQNSSSKHSHSAIQHNTDQVLRGTPDC